MIYDIFIGGPWEKHQNEKYKTKIKHAFKDKKIFDPEKSSTQKEESNETGNKSWFINNYNKLKESKTLIAYVPNFPLPGIGEEIGIYYEMNCKNKPFKPLKNLIIIWPKEAKPDYGKKTAKQYGVLVESVKEGIEELKQYFKNNE